jgi:hypothetical protein
MILLINAVGLGRWTLEKIHVQTTPQERLILGTGIGFGILGLAGYALGAMGWSASMILALVLFTILSWVIFSGTGRQIWNDIRFIKNEWALLDHGSASKWIRPAVFLTIFIAFLFALLPPAEGFDGLLYHLALPQRLLADKQILPYDIVQFWFPGLIEGNYLWALGLGSERTAQLIHWSFMILLLLLMFEWARSLFGPHAAWWSLAVIASMPSLPWVSSWAYNDVALIFSSMACLYTIWRWGEDTDHVSWLSLSGIFAGMAMSIKYTSIILPILCVTVIPFLERSNRLRIKALFRFCLPAILIAGVWLARNGIIMGNPFYPFVFGGRFWDSFRTEWLNAPGTGLGWDIHELLLLPLTVTLGYRDQNYFDGRMGPLYLLLIPVAFWMLWKYRSAPGYQTKALLILIGFGVLNYAAWMWGVIQSLHLWQSRLLWPGLMPLAIPIGLGITHLVEFDLRGLRASFILKVMVALVITFTLMDNGLSLLVRRPLAYTLGIESRRSYFERMQPGYAAALELVAMTPSNSSIYFIFEPRSYDMTRKVQPDGINDNLMHDLYIHGTAEAVLQSWREKGYTHLLINPSHLERYLPTDDPQLEEIERLLSSLQLVAEQGNYQLYVIPDQGNLFSVQFVISLREQVTDPIHPDGEERFESRDEVEPPGDHQAAARAFGKPHHTLRHIF